jgi:hypothetical protein
MARTTEEYYQELLDKKASISELDVLSSDSTIAVWRLMLWVQAFCLSKFDELLDRYEATIIDKSNQIFFATGEWWQQKMFEFQYGDNIQRIVIDGLQYIRYPIIDTSKRIISKCAVITRARGGLTIKLATEAGKLTTEQINAVASYTKNIQPEGIYVELFSRDADKLQIIMDLIYDPIYTKEVVQTGVEQAIQLYIDSIDFTGEFDLRKMEDSIQKVAGVKSFVTKNAKGKPEGGSFMIFDRAYNAISGYYIIDQDFTLADSINYIASTSL